MEPTSGPRPAGVLPLDPPCSGPPAHVEVQTPHVVVQTPHEEVQTPHVEVQTALERILIENHYT